MKNNIEKFKKILKEVFIEEKIIEKQLNEGFFENFLKSLFDKLEDKAVQRKWKEILDKDPWKAKMYADWRMKNQAIEDKHMISIKKRNAEFEAKNKRILDKKVAPAGPMPKKDEKFNPKKK